MGNKPDLRTRQVSCPIAPAQAQGARMVATRQCRQLRIKAGSQEVSFFELGGTEKEDGLVSVVLESITLPLLPDPA